VSNRVLAAVEGGGTKFLVALAEPRPDGPPEIVDRIQIPTSEVPEETLGPISTWLTERSPDTLGIATFGPLDLDTGTIRETPKPGWSGVPVREALAASLPDVPVTCDTDVNGAALGEWRWGAAHGADVALYLTVGTGIGGGVVIAGSPLHGLGHPEMGHITVPRHPDDDHHSTCPRHSNCLEGMTSGPALAARVGRTAEEVPDDEPLWDLAVHYLAHGVADLALVLSPEVVVMGGGVMQQPGLLDRVAARLTEVLGGYIDTPRLSLPRFGQEAGLYGALALAEDALG
jgi:fructokinase